MDVWSLLLGVVTLALVAIAIIVVFGSLFRTAMSGTERAIWVLIILMFPLLGTLIWLSWGQDSFRCRLGQSPVALGRTPAPAEPSRH